MIKKKSVEPTVFKIFTKMPLSNVVWNLKIGKRSFSNSVFKHLKMSNITQTLLKKTLLPIVLFYFYFYFFQNHSFRDLNTENSCLESHTKQALPTNMFLTRFKHSKHPKAGFLKEPTYEWLGMCTHAS